MSKNQMKLDEVRKLILSLLLARKGATPVPVLERDYHEVEQERIPYRQFGYTDLVGFLQSMPEHFIIEQYNGCHYIRGIASEKSKHVSSLVACQKVNPKVSQKPSRHPSFYLHQPYNHRMRNKMNQMKLEEVRKLILSLLLARKGATSVPVLERDYQEAEQERIPYRQFGYTDLVGFLQNMPEHFIIEQYNGCHYIRGIASEKSKHVSSLVARQKVNPRVSQKPPRHPSFHLHQSYNHRMRNKMNQMKLDEVRKLILSLLLARKGATPMPVLERDYHEAEQERIPYRQFGYTDLVGFLQSMPEHFVIEQYNGCHYVRGIASEKSKHVSSLVARQKVNPRVSQKPPRHPSFHLHQSYDHRMCNKMNQMKLYEVRKLILSLLLARKGATPVPVLERDYHEAEQERIPYRQFGYTDLVGFLQSMPEHFVIEQYNGCHYVRGIASEKSKHLNSLVVRQKVNPRVSQKPPRHPSFHLHHSFDHRMRNKMKSQQIKIAPDKLFLLMQYIKNNPKGVSLQSAVVFVQQIMPFIDISTRELRAQLHELSHQLFLDGNMIYPVWSKDLHNAARQQPLVEEIQPRDKSPNDSGSPPTTQTVYAAGQEDFDKIQYLNDENDFVSADCASNYQGQQLHAETSKQFATNLAQYADCEQTDMFNYDKDNDMEVSEDFATMKSSMEIKKIAECFDLSQMINDRTKSRLDELIRKYPDGIWCADLPNLYFQEYKVRLNYNQLGFASVREFTSYLPKIFYMTQVNKTDDFRLYSADKGPIVPKTEPLDMAQTLNDQYDEHSTVQAQCNDDDDDDAPIPADVSPTITKNFAPNDVMNYNDSVEKILVTELKRNKSYLGVCVVEVFHPNFFWVHLRENKRRFHKMMDELSEFYECNRSTYTIAKIALQKEMNCACVYMGRWHRGIIKSVKPDFRVTVFFYDYGTLKTYAPEDVYYLHKKFSFLPAQAIPCGLCNVKPIVGDRWKKSVIDQFVDKIADHLLVATIISIDSTYNSMMIVLTDTSEEEDVHINDWLVKERLAQAGKTVRIHDIIYYLRSNTIKPTSIKIFHTESAIDVNRPQHYRNQSISHDKRTYRLSDVKTEDIENKTVKSLHNVPISKKALLQMLWSKSPDSKSLHAKSLDAKCPDAKALDVQSQSKNYQKEESKSSRKLVPVLERLKISNRNRKSISNPNTSTSEADTDNENNARQIDSNRKVKSQNNNEDYNCYDYMNFSLRDSDNENETKDFGTFKSLYGGHGLMEPFDWSVIKEENNLPHRTITTMPDNLDMSIRKRDSDVEDESGSHNQKNEILGKQYFLNMTCMEKEIFVPENNIDYNVENKSDFIKMLRDKTASKIVTVIFAPNKFKISQDSSQSEDTSNSNINIVELNDVTSSREMDQKINGNGKVCETRNYQKMENDII